MSASDPITAIEISGEKLASIELDAAQAHIILNERGFEHQRELDRAHVVNIADSMASGEWVGSSTLTFAPNGGGRLKLVDGQHRLRGFAEYARRTEPSPTMPFTIQVANTIADEAYALLDSMQKKRAASVIGAALQLPVPIALMKNALSAASHALLYSGFDPTQEFGENKKKVRGIVPFRLRRDYVDARRDAFLILGETILAKLPANRGNNKVRSAMISPRVMPVILETLAAESGEATAFWRAVVTNNDPNEVQSVLRDTFVEGTPPAKNPGAASHKARWAANAWNSRNADSMKVTVSRDKSPQSVTLDRASYDSRDIAVSV